MVPGSSFLPLLCAFSITLRQFITPHLEDAFASYVSCNVKSQPVVAVTYLNRQGRIDWRPWHVNLAHGLCKIEKILNKEKLQAKQPNRQNKHAHNTGMLMKPQNNLNETKSYDSVLSHQAYSGPCSADVASVWSDRGDMVPTLGSGGFSISAC